MTKKENFVAIKGILNEIGNSDFDEFIDHEVELLGRKRSKSSAPTKRQKENVEVKARILEVLTADNGVTCTEIAKMIGDESLTNQRISALLRQMKDNGEVNKEMVKGKALFTLA